MLTEYLNAMARFHNYSFGNIMLIARQKPHATNVAGIRTWNSLGRFVKRGEKGIMILAPMLGRKKAEGVAESTADAKETTAQLYGFRAVYVFDVGQTEGGEFMQRWMRQTPYSKANDWVFPSFKLKGRQPRAANMLVEDYLRPAAVGAGVLAADWEGRFGFHNLRHSLASYLVRTRTDPKTVQALFRHSDVKTTLQLYSHSVSEDRMAAQGAMLSAILGNATDESGLRAD